MNPKAETKKAALPAVVPNNAPMALPSQLPVRSVERQVSTGLEFTEEQVGLIKRHIAPDATNDELQVFLYHCKKTGLDPLAKQIYFQKRSGKPVYITSIDGFRLIAGRTGQYAGSDDTVFDNEDSPKKATTTVYRIVQGQRVSYTATARWDEYCPPMGSNHMWKKMPCTMLAKCSEALALRKGFPNELGGTYSEEEMQRSEVDDGRIVPQRPPEDGGDGNTEPLSYRIDFGKYAQRSLEEVGVENLRSYVNYLESKAKKDGKPIDPHGKVGIFIEKACDYIAAFENAPIEEDVPF